MKTSTRVAFGIIGICIVVLVAWALWPRPVSDTQQIQDQIRSAVDGANRHSVGAVMAVISPNYSDQNGLQSLQVRLLLAHAFNGDNGLRFTVSPPMVSVDGSQATSDCTVTVTDSSGSQVFDHALHLVWHKDRVTRYAVFPGTEWRVVSAQYGGLPDMLM